LSKKRNRAEYKEGLIEKYQTEEEAKLRSKALKLNSGEIERKKVSSSTPKEAG
jgi:hypothetical protein